MNGLTGGQIRIYSVTQAEHDSGFEYQYLYWFSSVEIMYARRTLSLKNIELAIISL